MPPRGWWTAKALQVERFDGALCATGMYDPEMWTIIREEGTSLDHVKSMQQRAQTICVDCPVITQCGRYAINHPELQGVWGGMLDEQRAEIRKRMHTVR